MHPAPSIILFTALSGLGFGLMVWLGLTPGDKSAWVMGTFCALALALSSAGLVSSTFHLGHPERALKALTQWRSSWLSREGIVAILTLGCFTLYAGFWVLLDQRIPVLGWLSAALALLTVYCTAMIYTQMKSVPRWNMGLTPVLFLGYALTGGAWLAGEVTWALWLTAALGLLQVAVWAIGDGRFADTGSSTGTATGLSPMGDVRLLEAPHSGPNYLLREMVHVIGRKHSQKLRVIGMICLALLPLALGLVFEVKHMLAGVIVLMHLAGLLVTRWLFFAEAEHVVGLYYGKR